MAMTGTITVLFTDLVGSTELLSGLGDDAADELRRAYFKILRDTVTRHSGREVKNLGDGIMAVFASAIDALHCAIDIQRTVQAHNREEDVSLGVRIGLEVGEPIAEEEDYFGSSDGERWQRVPSRGDLGGHGNQMILGVTSTPMGLVAVGRVTHTDGEIDGALWTSVDGTSWKLQTSSTYALPGSEQQIKWVVADGGTSDRGGVGRASGRTSGCCSLASTTPRPRMIGVLRCSLAAED